MSIVLCCYIVAKTEFFCAFVGAPVRPNMLNMPKSASASVNESFVGSRLTFLCFIKAWPACCLHTGLVPTVQWLSPTEVRRLSWPHTQQSSSFSNVVLMWLTKCTTTFKRHVQLHFYLYCSLVPLWLDFSPYFIDSGIARLALLDSSMPRTNYWLLIIKAVNFSPPKRENGSWIAPKIAVINSWFEW